MSLRNQSYAYLAVAIAVVAIAATTANTFHLMTQLDMEGGTRRLFIMGSLREIAFALAMLCAVLAVQLVWRNGWPNRSQASDVPPTDDVID